MKTSTGPDPTNPFRVSEQVQVEDKGMSQRFDKQIQFLVEIDKVKHIVRRTRLFDGSRHENDAEHAWHLAMMALTFREYAHDTVDILRVIKMVLVHDLVEIDAGDIFLYDAEGLAEKSRKEKAAAERIFGLLPEDQGRELKELWEEFESRETPEARFAAALDRLEPILQNAHVENNAWMQHGIRKSQVLGANKKKIKEGSPRLWEYVEELLADCIARGKLKE